MMPYDTCRLYQVERAKSPAEIRRADEQAARVASAVSSLFRGITQPSRLSTSGSRRPRGWPRTRRRRASPSAG